MTLGFGEVFHPEATAAKGVDHRGRVAGDAPVGADDSIILVGAAQQVFDEVLAVGVPHVFAVFLVQVPRDGVVRHDGRHGLGWTIQLESTFHEGAQVVLEVVSRVHSIFTEGIVSVTSAFTGAAAGPVFGHSTHAVLAPAVGTALGGLQAVAVDFSQLSHLVRIGAEGILKAHPTGLCG